MKRISCSAECQIDFRLSCLLLLLTFCCGGWTHSAESQEVIGSRDIDSPVSRLDQVVLGKRRKGQRPRLHRTRHTVVDNNLLTDSLQLRRDQACEGQRLTLRCPAHTQLVIESTFFGRSVPYSELCPPRPVNQQEDDSGKGSEEQSLAAPSATPASVPTAWQEQYEDLSCDVTNAHSKVMEICQYRRKCKINANSRFFGRDPCPMTSKYLQVAYKCKPSRFGSESFCEGSKMELGCKTNQRLAIYSATYGRTVANNPVECSETAMPLSYDCTLDVLHKLIQVCHAQSKCAMAVEDSELGSPGCPEGTRKYLNVIFICVSEEVFSDNALTGHLGSEESYEFPTVRASPAADSAVVPTTLSTQNDASADFGTAHHPRSFIPSMANGVSSSTSTNSNRSLAETGSLGGVIGVSSPSPTPSLCLPESVPNAVIQVQNWLSTYEYIHRNHEKFFLYFGLSASTGIIALLLFCIVQLCWRHRGRSREANTEFNDKCSASRASSKMEVASAHTPTVFEEGRVEMTDFGREGISFLRFNHPTPPRNNNNNNGTPAVSVAAATSSFPSHQFYS